VQDRPIRGPRHGWWAPPKLIHFFLLSSIFSCHQDTISTLKRLSVPLL